VLQHSMYESQLPCAWQGTLSARLSSAGHAQVGEAVNILLERKVEEMLRSPAAHSVPHAGRPSQLPLLRLKVQHRRKLSYCVDMHSPMSE